MPLSTTGTVSFAEIAAIVYGYNTSQVTFDDSDTRFLAGKTTAPIHSTVLIVRILHHQFFCFILFWYDLFGLDVV